MATAVEANVLHDLGGNILDAKVDQPRLPRPSNPLKSTEHLYSEAQRPKLKFLFDDDIYRERAARHVCSRDVDGKGESELPVGFPPRVEGHRGWSGKEYADESTYAVTLDPADVKEVEKALKVFQAQGEHVGPGQVCPANFPLPTLGPRLRAMASTVFHGRGFVLVRGLGPARYSSLENIMIFNGITGYIAPIRGCRDDFGNMSTCETCGPTSRAPLRPTYTQDALPFHNDAAEVIAMYGVHAADFGGDTTFAWCATIYNDLAATRPDVLRTMAEPDWKYPEATEPLGWSPRALLFPSPHGPYWFFSRRRLTGVPPMSERQAEALDVFELAARRNAFAVRVCVPATSSSSSATWRSCTGGPPFRDRGCCRAAVATGTGSACRPGAPARRHIMRTFLSDDRYGWRPAGLTEEWSRIYEGAREGVWTGVEGVEVRHVLNDGDRCV